MALADVTLNAVDGDCSSIVLGWHIMILLVITDSSLAKVRRPCRSVPIGNIRLSGDNDGQEKIHDSRSASTHGILLKRSFLFVLFLSIA